MSGSHLSHDEFFNKLGELFVSRKGKDHGSVRLTQKRLSFGRSSAAPTNEDPLSDIANDNDNAPSTTFPVLIRATNGKSGSDRKADKRVKLATVVDSDSLDAFYARYAEICRAGMLALKPRDRSKRKTKGKKKKPAAA